MERNLWVGNEIDTREDMWVLEKAWNMEIAGIWVKIYCDMKSLNSLWIPLLGTGQSLGVSGQISFR